jgi:hypothetical protein
MKNIPEDTAKDAQRVLKETMLARDLEHEAEIIASAIMAERERCEGIEADLDAAIEVAWNRGATDWVRMNYPKHYERFTGR